jgi:ferric-dicitrate binding protein FerR (iron transport regulator)
MHQKLFPVIRWAALAAILILAGHPAWAGDAAKNQKNAVGTLVVRIGSVEILKAGVEQWSKAEKGMLICEGDRVRTREISRAAILLQDGSLTRLNENSDLLFPVKEQDKKNRVKLLLGHLWAKITKQETNLEIETPSAVAAIKGTELELWATVDGDRLVVWDGTVRFVNSMGDILVRASQEGRSQKGQGPKGPVQIDLGKLDQWFESVVEVPANKSLKLTIKDSSGKEQKLNLNYHKK